MKVNEAVACVVDHLSAAGKHIEPASKAGLGRYVSALISRGATPEQIEAFANHYGARLAAGAKIKPSQAFEDVVNGEIGACAPMNGGAMGVKRRLEDYEWLFDLSERQHVVMATIERLQGEGVPPAEIDRRVFGRQG